MKPEGEIDMENGILKYRGVSAIIISRSTQERLIREMHNLVGRGILKAFRLCGSEGGEGVYGSLLKFAGIKDDKDPSELTDAERKKLIEEFCKLEEDIGWGKYSVQENTDGCIIKIEKSWFAEALEGEVGYPVCTYLVGYFEALFSKIYGQEMKVEEKQCSAIGDPYCEFHIEKQ